ncbi:MAG: chemotaxis protein methyltransferase CheR [bacterium]|jgi:chemotaxis protein methyltransferase CheR
MEIEITNQQHEQFAAIAYRETGIKIPANKQNFLQNRLSRRLKALSLKSFQVYLDLLKKPNSGEIPSFIDTITTNETFFFRCPKHFYLLSKEIFPKIGSGDINIWSAAASTGAEAYSIAISALERLPNAEQRKVKIYASDIDREALKAASEGVFNQYALRLVRPEHLKKYFHQVSDGQYKIIPKLRKMILLGRHRLKDPFTQAKLDIIFCRNVLIYFDEPTKKEVINNLLSSLKKGGYLFLGESEIIPDFPNLKRIDASVAQKI